MGSPRRLGLHRATCSGHAARRRRKRRLNCIGAYRMGSHYQHGHGIQRFDFCVCTIFDKAALAVDQKKKNTRTRIPQHFSFFLASNSFHPRHTLSLLYRRRPRMFATTRLRPGKGGGIRFLTDTRVQLSEIRRRTVKDEDGAVLATARCTYQAGSTPVTDCGIVLQDPVEEDIFLSVQGREADWHRCRSAELLHTLSRHQAWGHRPFSPLIPRA